MVKETDHSLDCWGRLWSRWRIQEQIKWTSVKNNLEEVDPAFGTKGKLGDPLEVLLSSAAFDFYDMDMVLGTSGRKEDTELNYRKAVSAGRRCFLRRDGLRQKAEDVKEVKSAIKWDYIMLYL